MLNYLQLPLLTRPVHERRTKFSHDGEYLIVCPRSLTHTAEIFIRVCAAPAVVCVRTEPGRDYKSAGFIFHNDFGPHVINTELYNWLACIATQTLWRIFIT
jgi:hypothetical protein